MAPQRRTPGLQAVSLAGALVFLSCCGAGVMATRPYPAPAAEDLRAALERRHAAVTGIDLETRTTSWLQGERLAASVDMIVERRGRLRFDAEISLQGNVATLVTTGEEFASVDVRAGLYRKGPACADNVASLIGIPLLPAEIAAILLGDAPLPADARATSVGWDGRRGADVLALDTPPAPVDGLRADATRRLWVSFRRRDDGRRDVVAVEGEAARGRWRVAYDDLEDVGGHAFPKLIRFAEPGRDFDDGVEIKVKKRTPNPTINEQAFALLPPEGFKVEIVPCCRGCEVKVK